MSSPCNVQRDHDCYHGDMVQETSQLPRRTFGHWIDSDGLIIATYVNIHLKLAVQTLSLRYGLALRPFMANAISRLGLVTILKVEEYICSV
jgi:hypothetical protein